jgi:hypothetical protein
MTDTVKCYLLTAKAGDVELKRPSTSRHRIIAEVHSLFCSTPKDGVDWTMTIERVELDDAEFKALHAAWQENFLAEVTTLGVEAGMAQMLAEGAEAPAIEATPEQIDPKLPANLAAQLKEIWNTKPATPEQIAAVEEKLSDVAGTDVTIEQEPGDD